MIVSLFVVLAWSTVSQCLYTFLTLTTIGFSYFLASARFTFTWHCRRGERLNSYRPVSVLRDVREQQS